MTDVPFPAFFLLAGALGVREHLRGRREEQRMLDFEAERQDEINSIDVGIDAMGATNIFDARQIEVMNRQFQTAQGMLRSLDPKLQAIGANMLQDLDTAVRGNIQQNESEARADLVRVQDQAVLAAGLGKADNEKRLERELTMNEQLNSELKSFLDARLSYAKVQNLLDNDDQLASLAGLTAFVQSIDNSVVREGELLKYQGANGLITQLVNIVNKSEGRDFDPATKIAIRNASAAIMNAEKSRAIAVTNSFQDRAIAFELSPEKVLSGVDENLFSPIIIDKAAQQAAQEQADAAEARFRSSELRPEPIEPSVGAKVITPLILGTQRILADVRRSLTGVKLLRSDDGGLFEQAPDGTMTQIGREDLFTTDDGRTLQLVDRGQGRFEWVEIEGRQQGPLEKILSPEARERRARRFESRNQAR